jgi:hypothetical protein
MRVEAFIPDWPGEKQHAAALANQVARFYPTRILDDPDEYFNAQWSRARHEFKGDILLWVMADVTIPFDFSYLCDRMERVMGDGEVGWYAPNVDWTGFIFDKKTLVPYEPDIFEVPNTDSLCFAIRGDVVRAMPHIDPKLCFMWGMDFTAILTAHNMGYKIVRDYRFKVGHPNNTGYSIDEASLGMKKLFESFDPKFREQMEQWVAKTNNLKVRS